MTQRTEDESDNVEREQRIEVMIQRRSSTNAEGMNLINVLANLCTPVLEAVRFSDVKGSATRETYHTEPPPPGAQVIRRVIQNSVALC
jgi:hypothetical protein